MITTYTGRRVDPLNLRPEDVDIVDVAHALALCNRFAGHTRVPVSVAQHSVYVARLCWRTEFALQGLLHDATEAYLGDVTKWLKERLPAYLEAEAAAHEAIMTRFGCAVKLDPSVETADRLMCRLEAEQQMPRLDVPSDQEAHYPPLTEEERRCVGFWEPWSWDAAEHRFLSEFHSLRRRRP